MLLFQGTFKFPFKLEKRLFDFMQLLFCKIFISVIFTRRQIENCRFYCRTIIKIVQQIKKTKNSGHLIFCTSNNEDSF